MRMLRDMFRTLCLVGAVLISVSTAGALEKGQSGIGFFGSANVPLFKFGEWYSASPKLGISYNYIASSRIVAEVEYHYSSMLGGDLDTREFTWPIDSQNYRSPNVDQGVTFNSLTASGLLHFNELGGGTSPYIMGGVGFFGFSNEVSGLIFPGQSGTSLDTSIQNPAFHDKVAALTFSFGGGISIAGSEQFVIDLRLRYNVIMGELRPLEDWGLEKVFPMQAIDLSGGIKYYW